jgi:hypothetical protein
MLSKPISKQRLSFIPKHHHTRKTMAKRTYPCIQRTKLRIGKDTWDWCALFNAKIDQLHCEKCEYRMLYQEPFEMPKEPCA